MQLPLFTLESSWKLPDMGTLPDWSQAKRIGLDIETHDPQLRKLGIGVRRGGKVVGVSFAIEDGPKFYLPFGHLGGDNLDEKQVWSYIHAQLKQFTGIIVGANISYDLDYLLENGCDFSSVKWIRDVQVADPLIYELHESYSLDNIAKRWGFAGKEVAGLEEAARIYRVDPKAGMWQLPGRFVGPYAETDAELPLQILRRQERKIDELDLWEIYNLESKVTPLLVKMRRRGVRVNEKKLEAIENWSLEQETMALQKVYQDTGVRIAVGDVWKPDAIEPALVELGVSLKKTSTGKASIDKDVLNEIDHPVAKALTWARKTNKLRTTFAASVRTYMVNGRIHPTYNQIARETEAGDQKGARYGRLSCTDPNLQQQPSRDEFAKEWRSIYEPEEGMLWASKDYSQQEPRWTTHFAAVLGFPMAGEAAKRYRDDPTTDNHNMMAELTGLPRKYAKNIFLGICYGEGGAKLCDDIGLPTRWAMATKEEGKRIVKFFDTEAEARAAGREYSEKFIWRAAGEEGQRILDEFEKRCPYISKLADKAEGLAKKRGFITTIGGRRLHFPERQDGSFDWCHKALNRVIQGSSADQTKTAMVMIDEQMPDYWMNLQVHDEIAGSARNREEAEAAAQIMRDCIKAQVPFKVDVEIGTSWGASM
jgi:DNA polymerase I-like protein with 3'-5' exonuclease and polymerase domains